MLKIGFAFGLTLGLIATRAEARTVVRSLDDLPRFSYPVHGSVAEILTSTPAAFAATVAPMRHDIDRILVDYDIVDDATLRALLEARLGAEIASGKEDRAALSTIAAIRTHEVKAEARLLEGLAPEAFLEARLASGEPTGVCPRGFQVGYARRLKALPWSVVGAAETSLRGLAQIATANFMIGMVAPEIQPTLDRAHALSNGAAWRLMATRLELDVITPCRAEIFAATDAYVQAHASVKSDIWAAREAASPPGASLTPVRVAIWDSGFDSALFPGQLLTSRDGRPVTGPAYDVDYKPTKGELAPLSAQEKAAYPQVVADSHGISDLQNGVDGPAADAFRKRIAAMSPAQTQAFMEQYGAIESYMHGTHVAGIAARGNPAIRLVSARVTYDTKPVPTPPTEDLLQRTAASSADFIAWFRAHKIRVVNMSWWDRPSNYEAALEKNGMGGSVEGRKIMARHLFTIERDGLYAALKRAPEILFVTIAGNNDSDNAFEETIPSSFRLPNLLVVGAVDQAGRQTNFTSTGANIGVFADGYEVESVVPGGARVRMSGTSMAAPEVVNLAVKLLAIDPRLTPVQLIAMITATADPGESPAIRRINPKLAVARLSAERPH